jgi:hypothetical protein
MIPWGLSVWQFWFCGHCLQSCGPLWHKLLITLLTHISSWFLDVSTWTTRSPQT